MTPFFKTIGITLLTAATALGPMTSAAQAGGDSGAWQREWNQSTYYGKRFYGKDYKHHYRGKYKPHRGYRHHRDNSDAVLLGIIGLGVGAAIGGAIANSHNSPRVIHRPAPRVRDYYPDQPRAVRSGGSFEPWTQSWLRYCTNKYRSFNASTGTYRGYDGRDHFCVAR